MKLFGSSAYGKTVTNKENFLSTTYGNEDNIGKKIKTPNLKDLELLYGQKYEVISSKREIRMDQPLQIGVAVYHVAKLRMLDFYNIFIDKYFDRSDFEFAFSDNSINEIIKPNMIGE